MLAVLELDILIEEMASLYVADKGVKYQVGKERQASLVVINASHSITN